jgi:DNA repair exonuclease SbcCD ATPase subunit
MTSKRIVKFNAKNVLRLSAVEITPQGNVITLGGKNGAGKSSVLNAIQMALGGKKVTPSKPIRNGSDEASIVLDLGDTVVERVITATTDKLVVKNKEDGFRAGNPQTVLNQLFNTISFDPLQFVSEDPGKQGETLRKLTNLDFTLINQKRAAVYEERTHHGREQKSLRTQYEAAPKHDDAPAVEVSVKELMASLKEAQTHNEKRQAMVERIAEGETDHEKDLENLADLKAKLAEIQAEIAAHEEAMQREQAIVQGVREQLAGIDAIDTTDIENQIGEAEEVNSKVRANATRADLGKKVADADAKWATLTAQIDELDKQKQATLTSVKFPVEGLGLDDNGVTFNGLPFSQASRAEQLRVSLAIGIAMNPKLRVLFVRDGSLLDEDGLALIAKMADENDCQVWVEDARTTDPTAIVIEDGHVREEPKAAE